MNSVQTKRHIARIMIETCLLRACLKLFYAVKFLSEPYEIKALAQMSSTPFVYEELEIKPQNHTTTFCQQDEANKLKVCGLTDLS